jgi:hypothetical protein
MGIVRDLYSILKKNTGFYTEQKSQKVTAFCVIHTISSVRGTKSYQARPGPAGTVEEAIYGYVVCIKSCFTLLLIIRTLLRTEEPKSQNEEEPSSSKFKASRPGRVV